ncbi:MAG: phosphatase PAP2 family protein [Planctomycetia bacterium]|nr:phosphatase PAP2 family protein [Planctomycetia bacterium]
MDPIAQPDALDPPANLDEFRRRLAARPLWTVVLLLIAAGVAVLWVDMRVSRVPIDPTKSSAAAGDSSEEILPPSSIDRLVGLAKDQLARAEVFGYGVSVAVMLLAVLLVDAKRRWAWPRLVMMSLGAGLSANIVKLFLARTRPKYCAMGTDVWHTFGKFLAFGKGGSHQQSFPSSHTATAVGLAVALSTLYPRGRWLFFALAALCGCQRIAFQAHFTSDVCWGAALGWLVAVGLGRAKLEWLGIDRLGRWMGRERNDQ